MMSPRWMLSGMAGFALVFGTIPALWAGDWETAKRYYEQAQREADPNRQLQLLNQSLDAQPSAAAWLVIGEIGQRTHRLDLAEKAFKAAYNLADSDANRVRALSGLAEVYYAQGNLPEARKFANAATKRVNVAGAPPPVTLTALTGQIARDRGQLPIQAERIVGELRPGPADKDYDLVPSIDLLIHFDYDRADLDARGVQEIEEVAKAFQVLLDAGDLRSVQVIGHTDAQGTEDYNQRLSECRALTVQREVTRLVPGLAGKLCAMGKGKSQLLFAERSPENNRLNRRVEIQLVETCSAGPEPNCRAIGQGPRPRSRPSPDKASD